jgi:uncharacterized NAD-dependent epimerase/dehydratase family protein
MPRRIVCLTEGHTNPRTAKTATAIVRYRPDEAVAVLDKTQKGGSVRQLLGVDSDIPIIGSLAESPEADTLAIGIAPPGGKVPTTWRPIILEAISRGMNILSGLHDFLSDDPEFASAAKAKGVTLFDVRKNNEKEIARKVGLREKCLRIHTVGHDCSIGKMVVSVEIAKGLKNRGKDAKFVATGQTGIMIEGDGLPIDCVVADFVAGAAEKLVLQNQHHEIIVVEGQGSLSHPSYSGVTLGLLHGCAPHGLVLCCELGRTKVGGLEAFTIPALAEIKKANELLANFIHPCKVIGIGINGSRVTPVEAEKQREQLRAEFGLPVCDVYRDGPGELVDAVLKLQQELFK